MGALGERLRTNPAATITTQEAATIERRLAKMNMGGLAMAQIMPLLEPAGTDAPKVK